MTLTSKKNVVPTTTLSQHRIRLYQPTRRPVEIRQESETQFGRVVVEGKIGQTHADMMEAIMFCSEKWGEVDGRIKLLVDPARVRRVAGITGGRQMADLLRDLMRVYVKITVTKPREFTAHGHLIDEVVEARTAGGELITRPNPLGGERKMWRVVLGRGLIELMERDFHVHRDPSAIARLQHGISQAVARHALTHRSPPGGWRLDVLVKAVAGDLSDTNLRHRRHELRADADALAEIGIEIDGDRVNRVERAALTRSRAAMTRSRAALTRSVQQ